jgi:hypothetical protein
MLDSRSNPTFRVTYIVQCTRICVQRAISFSMTAHMCQRLRLLATKRLRKHAWQLNAMMQRLREHENMRTVG